MLGVSYKNVAFPLMFKMLDKRRNSDTLGRIDLQNGLCRCYSITGTSRRIVYQVGALNLNQLTPTSIGLLDNFKVNDQKMFAVANAIDAEAFGITLEPKEGS